MIPESAVGPVLAALVTALISLLGLIISKESKVSDFRQQWIDALRAELADYVAHLHNISALKFLESGSTVEVWEKAREDLHGVNATSASIKLRINKKEKDSKALISILNEVEEMFVPGKKIESETIDNLETRLVSTSQELLKSEWRRVKNGELVYQCARAASFALLLASIIALAGFAV